MVTAEATKSNESGDMRTGTEILPGQTWVRRASSVGQKTDFTILDEVTEQRTTYGTKWRVVWNDDVEGTLSDYNITMDFILDEGDNVLVDELVQRLVDATGQASVSRDGDDRVSLSVHEYERLIALIEQRKAIADSMRALVGGY